MKILVIRFSSIGDIILTTPVLEAIKNRYPESKLHFVTLKKFKEAISGNSNIDKLILFDKFKYKGINGIYRFNKKIRDNKYDVVIDLHSKIRSKLLSLFLGVKTYRYKKRKLWKTLLVKMGLIKYSTDDTIINNYFGAVKKAFNINRKNEDIKFNFNSKDLEKVKKYKNSIILAPGASKNTKKWPGEYFAKLCVKLNKWSNEIILIGSKKEYGELEEIRKDADVDVLNLAGKLSLKESGALMSIARFVMTNDSGPFHIARGVNSKVFVIFGPTDPNMFGYNKDSILIYNNSYCSPCSLHGDKSCPKDNFICMEDLKVNKVYNVIKNNL